METQISAWAIVKSKIKIVRSLESKMEIDDELMIGLLENVGLNNGVFELFLEDEILLFESLKCIQLVIGYQSSEKNFSKSPWAKNFDNIEGGKVNLVRGNLTKFFIQCCFVLLYDTFSVSKPLFFFTFLNTWLLLVIDLCLDLWWWLGLLWSIDVICSVILSGIVGNRVGFTGLSMILIALLTLLAVNCISGWPTAVSYSKCKVEYIFLDFLYYFLQLWRFVFNYCFIFLYFWYHLWIFL